jgi:fatty-acyl-CoA synthase
MRDISTNGWIHTDDAGYIDHQGRLHVCGRIHEVNNRTIDKIYPIEVEKVLATYPDVKAVVVIGVPDERLNEEICACDWKWTGSDLESSVTEFDQWASLPQWKADDLGLTRKQTYTLVFKEFPMTKTGKTNRKALKAIALQKLGLNLKG